MATDTPPLREQTGLDSDDSTDFPLGLALVSAAIAAAVVSPVIWLVLRASTIDHPITTLLEPSHVDVLITSVALTAVVTIASIAIGVPLAVLTTQSDLPFRRFWTVALALPLVIPSYIGAFAVVSAFGPRGVLADLLAPLGVTELPTIYGFHGTALVLTLYVYPYVFLTTRASLLNFDGRLVDAARTLGHSRLSAFRRITLPQIAPGILAGALLVALYTLSDFGTPAIMQLDVFTRQIFVQFNSWSRETAALLSMELLGVTVVILAIESRLSSGDPEAYVSQDPRGAEDLTLGRWKWPASAFCTFVALLALAVPLAILGMWLFRTAPGYATYAYKFEAVFAWNSTYVSLLAALVAVLAALPIAHLSARRSSVLSRLPERATYVGYAMPGIVLGLALVFFGATYARFLYQTIPLLVFAYIVRFLPQAVGTISSSVLQVDPSVIEASRTLGHDSFSTFRKVTWPLIAPGVVAGAALVFLTTMKELPATLMLHPTEFTTLVTYIWLVQDAGLYGRAAVPALVLVGLSAISMLVLLGQEQYNAE